MRELDHRHTPVAVKKEVVEWHSVWQACWRRSDRLLKKVLVFCQYPRWFCPPQDSLCSTSKTDRTLRRLWYRARMGEEKHLELDCEGLLWAAYASRQMVHEDVGRE
jgi:hypothetical protein